MILIGAMSIGGCQDLPPDTTEQTRMAREMDKMEAEQVQSDIARAAADASAEAEASKNKAVGIAQEKHAREE